MIFRGNEELLVFAFFCVLLAVTFQDVKARKIQNGCHIAIVLLAIVKIFAVPEIKVSSQIIGALCVSIPLLFITLIVPGAFGGGDIKLMAAGGLFLGGKLTIVSAAVSIFLAGIYVVFLIVKKKADRKEQFALGPFLCAGMVIGTLWGQQLIDGYFHIAG